MDDVIYEEFKGTGNMELHMDRTLAERRVYPAIDILRSGTRREELLLSKDQLQKLWVLRKFLSEKQPIEASSLVLEKIRETKNNGDFFNAMTK